MGGVGRSAQIKYEDGERRPDADYLERVAKALDVRYLLTGFRSDPQHGVSEGGQIYDVRRYVAVADALDSVLAVQARLGLLFSASQIKVLLAYAFTQQADEEALVSFVEAAYEFFGEEPLKTGGKK